MKKIEIKTLAMMKRALYRAQIALANHLGNKIAAYVFYVVSRISEWVSGRSNTIMLANPGLYGAWREELRK